MNMAVISPVTTTTCVTWLSFSGPTWARRSCSSPQMELDSNSSSVAQYKASTPLWTLAQVSTQCKWHQILIVVYRFGYVMIQYVVYSCIYLQIKCITNQLKYFEIHGSWFSFHIDLVSCVGLVSRKSYKYTWAYLCVLILLGNVTAAFNAQRHAEPHGPLASIFPHTICDFQTTQVFLSRS